jgi:large subunit ribosomal protein L17
MRHKIAGRKLNRTSTHRRVLFQNLVNSLITHEQIKTTLPKAKALRPVVEKIITLARGADLHTRRVLISRLQSQEVVSKLMGEVTDRYKERAGGYTRILKAGFRYGDAAPMAIISLVDRPMTSTALVVEDTDALKVIDQAPAESKKASNPKEKKA